MGAAVFSALTVTGGAICSLLLDQFGLPGFGTAPPISLSRVIGGAVPMARSLPHGSSPPRATGQQAGQAEHAHC